LIKLINSRDAARKRVGNYRVARNVINSRNNALPTVINFTVENIISNIKLNYIFTISTTEDANEQYI
jgi:hypothetical protein